MPDGSLPRLLREIAACQHCEDLPCGPRPIVQLSSTAQVVIIGQAPGKKVHDTGVPWDDASGDHLREWLAVDRETFYDPCQLALLPMGFCYPGKGKSGDLPPRPECAPRWHQIVHGALREDPLLVLSGQYAQKYYLGALRKRTLTETVRAFERYLPKYFALPHPSWRSKLWMKKHPWFAAEVLPALRDLIAGRLGKQRSS